MKNFAREFDTSLSPEAVAHELQARLDEVQWCLGRACSNAGVADLSKHIARFSGVNEQYAMANNLKQYAPLIKVVAMSHAEGKGLTWWDLVHDFDWELEDA